MLTLALMGTLAPINAFQGNFFFFAKLKSFWPLSPSLTPPTNHQWSQFIFSPSHPLPSPLPQPPSTSRTLYPLRDNSMSNDPVAYPNIRFYIFFSLGIFLIPCSCCHIYPSMIDWWPITIIFLPIIDFAVFFFLISRRCRHLSQSITSSQPMRWLWKSGNVKVKQVLIDPIRGCDWFVKFWLITAAPIGQLLSGPESQSLNVGSVGDYLVIARCLLCCRWEKVAEDGQRIIGGGDMIRSINWKVLLLTFISCRQSCYKLKDRWWLIALSWEHVSADLWWETAHK